MNKWVYLQGDNPADALALIAVLRDNKDFYIIRRSCFSSLFNSNCNYGLSQYSQCESMNLISISPIESDSWKDKCDSIASQLGISKQSSYDVSLKLDDEDNIPFEYCKDPFGLLYLFPSNDSLVDLIEIDKLVRELEKFGVKFVSGGTNLIPCIKGTKDLRQLFSIPTICKIGKRLSFIITTERYMVTIGEAIGVKTFYISQVNQQLLINNKQVLDYLQIANIINAQL